MVATTVVTHLIAPPSAQPRATQHATIAEKRVICPASAPLLKLKNHAIAAARLATSAVSAIRNLPLAVPVWLLAQVVVKNATSVVRGVTSLATVPKAVVVMEVVLDRPPATRVAVLAT